MTLINCGIFSIKAFGSVPHTRPPPHLAADAEGLQWVEAEPARVSCLSEAVHELCVECPLQGGQTHQDHMLLFRGQLVPQDVMTSSGIKMKFKSY